MPPKEENSEKSNGTIKMLIPYAIMVLGLFTGYKVVVYKVDQAIKAIEKNDIKFEKYKAEQSKTKGEILKEYGLEFFQQKEKLNKSIANSELEFEKHDKEIIQINSKFEIEILKLQHEDKIINLLIKKD